RSCPRPTHARASRSRATGLTTHATGYDAQPWAVHPYTRTARRRSRRRSVVDQLEADTRPSLPSAPIQPPRWGLALTSAACTGAVLISHKTAPPAIVVTLILLAAAASIELARREAQRPGDVRSIAWTITGLYLLAVTRPPRFATDIWSYTMVGRIITAHHL